MNDPVPIRDLNCERPAQDFDAVTEWTSMRIDRARSDVRFEPLPGHETEFTTEWQIGPSAELAHSL
jgi:hypothetical protein